MTTFGELEPGAHIFRVCHGCFEAITVQEVETFDDTISIKHDRSDDAVYLNRQSSCQKVHYFNHPDTYHLYFSDLQLAVEHAHGDIQYRLDCIEKYFDFIESAIKKQS